MAFSFEEFHQCIRAFYTRSNQLNDRWQLVESPRSPYLTYSLVDTDCLKRDFHVVYSESYSVPVLYFNISRLNGALLPLDEVWSLFAHKKNSNLNMYETITQQEHPILHRPFFVLHPCHTETLLKKMTDSTTKQRFLAWLSIYGQSVGLPLLFDYALEVE